MFTLNIKIKKKTDSLTSQYEITLNGWLGF